MYITTSLNRVRTVELAAILAVAPALLLGGGCKQSRTVDREIPEARLVRAFEAARGDAARAMELAEAIKCRRLRDRLVAAGAVPRRLILSPGRLPLPRVDQGQALLSMFFHGGRLFRYLATNSGVRRLTPRDQARVDQALVLARDTLEYGDARTAGRPLWQQLRQLHRLLLEESKLHTPHIRRLLVLPDGLARYLPLQTLVTDLDHSGKPSFVAQRLVLSHAPCLGLVRPRQSYRGGGATLVVPAYSDNPRHLAGSRQEARTIARLLPGSTVLAGPRATVAALQRALTRPSPVVHFAGHGLAALEPGSPPELLFPAGDAVTVGSAGRLAVRAPLVVLSSCTTAYAARFRDGKRLMARVNLAEALLAAGARWVVAASWAAKDRWTAEQMSAFYLDLRRLGPAGALAQAHRHGIKRLVPPHPRFWATHTLYGSW